VHVSETSCELVHECVYACVCVCVTERVFFSFPYYRHSPTDGIYLNIIFRFQHEKCRSCVEGTQPPSFAVEFDDRYTVDVQLWKLLERQ
jgi:hypothetical protein